MFIEFVTNNPLISTLLAAAILGLVAWLWRMRNDHKDSQAILDALIKSGKETPYTFRSTGAIASETNLTEERVAFLCAKNPRIRRNTKEKQSWRLVD